MEIKYTISKQLQKNLIMAGMPNTSISQTTTIQSSSVDPKVLDDRCTRIDAEGNVIMDLCVPIPTVKQAPLVWPDGQGPASGNVAKRAYGLQWWGHGSWTSEAEHPLDFIIDSPETLNQALAEIDEIRQIRQAEADDKTREDAETFEARVDAYNREHAAKEAEEPEKDAPEEPKAPKPDPFEPYLKLEGLGLYLKHERMDDARRLVLDHIEELFRDKIDQLNYTVLENHRDYTYDSLNEYEEHIPLDALRALENVPDDIHGTPYVYCETIFRHSCLDVILEFDHVTRLIVINLYEWDINE